MPSNGGFLKDDMVRFLLAALLIVQAYMTLMPVAFDYARSNAARTIHHRPLTR
jgi:hypothetical protein